MNRAKRRKVSVGAGVAFVGAAAFFGAISENGARANENGGFWPRLGANVVSTSEISEKNDFAGTREGGDGSGATAARNSVESANFVGFSLNADFDERKSAVDGETRLVGWSEPDASPLNAERPVEGATPETPIETNGENGGKTKIGEEASRSKTPILRDKTTASKRSGGSFWSALVSTFGALAVVLGAFLALVAWLKRTGPKSDGGGALEVIDSLVVGDKARLLTIRWGNRLILAAKTPENIASLAEIADVDEANAMLAEIERRKETSASGGDVGATAAAIWKRGRDAASVWRTAFGKKGRRQ